MFQLLSKMAENDPEMQEMLAVKDRDWIVRGNAVAKVLEEMEGPWKGRFQNANERKRRGDGVVMPMAQFIRSLKPVLDMPVLKNADNATIAGIINAYWKEGIALVLPEPFAGDIEDYAVRRVKARARCTEYFPRSSRSSVPPTTNWATRSPTPRSSLTCLSSTAWLSKTASRSSAPARTSGRWVRSSLATAATPADVALVC
ncbi:hypothetical protein [Jatrophihabitans lederbergiae]|uniref:hypothetical protein n=1 Tax=Jatrophihabitans lederbergiae TaxID=3075547 RepID=UPI00288A0D92|nr:hypothetical protein [Jatrophihabitans sp. DSM 44399]